MGGFVPLPSPYNPYVGAAEQAGAGAASIFREMEVQKGEAQRQAQILQRQQAAAATAQQQRDLQNRFELSRLHAVPAEVEGRDPSGLITHTPNPNLPQNGQGTFLDVPLGNRSERYYIPTTAETPQAGEFMPTGQLGEALKTAGWDGKSKITPQQSHALMQALNEAQPKDETYDIDTSGQFLDTQGNPTAVMIGHKSGKVRPLDLSGVTGGQTGAAPATGPVPGASPGGAFDMRNWQQYTGDGSDWRGGGDTANLPPLQTQPAQTGAAPAKTGLTFQKKAAAEKKETLDDWVRIATDPKSPASEVTRAEAAIRKYREPGTESDKDRDAQRAEMAADRAERRQERADDRAEKQTKTFRGFEATKTKAVAAANKKYREALKTAITTKAQQDALDEYRSDVDDAQTEYEGNIQSETGETMPHNAWAMKIPPLPGPEGSEPFTPNAKGAPKSNPFRGGGASPNVNPFRH